MYTGFSWAKKTNTRMVGGSGGGGGSFLFFCFFVFWGGSGGEGKPVLFVFAICLVSFWSVGPETGICLCREAHNCKAACFRGLATWDLAVYFGKPTAAHEIPSRGLLKKIGLHSETSDFTEGNGSRG